jgi:hypothetical protein
VSADGEDRVIVTQASSGKGITGLVTIGMTRAEVKTAFGADQEHVVMPAAYDSDPLRVAYCEKQLLVSYGDTPVANNVEGVLTDDDVVRGIRTLPGFAGHTDTGISIGSLRSAVLGAYSGLNDHVDWSVPAWGGPADLYSKHGLGFGYSGTLVRSIGVAGGYMDGTAVAPGNLALNLVSLQAGGLTAALFSSTTFGTVKTLLGTPDVQGYSSLQGTNGVMLVYGSLGLRFVSICLGACPAINSATVTQIHISPPFAGKDGTNFGGTAVGIGTTEATWNAATNMPAPTDHSLSGLPMKVYGFMGGNNKVGVHFVEDDTCTRRAAFIVLGYIVM